MNSLSHNYLSNLTFTAEQVSALRNLGECRGQYLQDEWDHIPQGRIRRLVISMRRRCAALTHTILTTWLCIVAMQYCFRDKEEPQETEHFCFYCVQ